MHPGTRIASILLFFTMALSLTGQRNYIPRIYIETGPGINLSYFDVGGGSPGLSIQGSVLYDIDSSWRLGVTMGFHRTRGTDEGTPNAGRMYAYRSNLNELSVKGVYIPAFNPYPITRWKTKFEPRAFAAIGILQIQPKPNEVLANNSSDDYLSITPFLGIGIGLAYQIRRDLSLLFEGGSNLALSDYLEGYTNRQYSNSFDMFHALLVKLVYKVPVGW